MRASHARQSFHFQKITRTLKMNMFRKFAIPFVYCIEQSPKRKFENNVFLNSLLCPKMVKTVFDLNNGKNIV